MSHKGKRSGTHKAVFELFKNAMPEGGVVTFTIKSAKSMQPFFRDDDILLIKKVPIERIVPGDVVAYRLAGDICVHRCIYRRREDNVVRLRTKGDKMALLDPYTVSGQGFLGRVEVIRRGREVISLEGFFPKLASGIVARMLFLKTHLILLKERLFQRRQA